MRNGNMKFPIHNMEMEATNKWHNFRAIGKNVIVENDTSRKDSIG